MATKAKKAPTVPEEDPFAELGRISSGQGSGNATNSPQIPKSSSTKAPASSSSKPVSIADINQREYGGRNQVDMAALRALGDPMGSSAQADKNAALLKDPSFQAFLAGLNQPQPEEDPMAAFLAQFAGSGGSGGGGSGYDLSGELNGIAQAYQTRLDDLTRQQTEGNAEIDSAQKAGSDSINKRAADNVAEQAKTHASIQQSYSQALERSRAEAASLAGELQRNGIDPSRMAPTTTQSASYLEQAGLAQGALNDRLGQIANESLAARNSNNDLIATGARGQLTNNYASAKTQMDLQRQQAEDQVRQQAAAAARSAGGGGGGSAMDQAMAALKYQDLFQKVNGTGPSDPADYLKQNGEYDLSVLEPGSGAYNAAVNGGNPDSLLQKYYTSDVQQSDGSLAEQFDVGQYNSAYAQLANAKASQQAAARGDLTIRKQYAANKTIKNAISKLTFKGR